MLLITNKNIIPIFCWIFLLFFVAQSIPDEPDDPQGYSEIIPFNNRVLAVGTDGRVDYITQSGESVTVDTSSQLKLNTVFSNDEILIVAGDHGTIFYSLDAQSFHYAESGTESNINTIASLNGWILAGADKGLVLISQDGESWNQMQTDAKGDILSLTSNPSFLIGITDADEIIKSVDGFDWEISDYNQVYAGYNPHANFGKILVFENSIVIIGTHDNGLPCILFSSLGNVWTERLPAYYDDEGIIRLLTNKPNDILFDRDNNQIILACDDGVLFSLPNCTKCNQYLKISESNLNAITYVDHCLIIAGADYSVFIQRL